MFSSTWNTVHQIIDIKYTYITRVIQFSAFGKYFESETKIIFQNHQLFLLSPYMCDVNELSVANACFNFVQCIHPYSKICFYRCLWCCSIYKYDESFRRSVSIHDTLQAQLLAGVSPPMYDLVINMLAYVSESVMVDMLSPCTSHIMILFTRKLQ